MTTLNQTSLDLKELPSDSHIWPNLEQVMFGSLAVLLSEVIR